MIQKRIPKIRRMAPTTAVWNSRMSLKRQGFSSTHCTKLSLTPTRMTTAPSALIRASTSRASRAIRIYPQLFAGANSAEHLLQGRIPKYLAARRLDLKLPRREPRLQDRATLKTSHQGHFEMLFEQCDDQLHAAERIHQLRDEVVATAIECCGSSARCNIA